MEAAVVATQGKSRARMRLFPHVTFPARVAGGENAIRLRHDLDICLASLCVLRNHKTTCRRKSFFSQGLALLQRGKKDGTTVTFYES